MDQDRKELAVEEYWGLVKSCVRYVARVYPSGAGDEDALFQEGMLGLIKAVDRCEEERLSCFSAFAKKCIIGGMIEYIRNNGPLSRKTAYRIKDKENVKDWFVKIYKREPNQDELAWFLGVNTSQYNIVLNDIQSQTYYSLESEPENTEYNTREVVVLEDIWEKKAYDPEQYLIDKEEYEATEKKRLELLAMIEELPEKAKIMVQGRYFEGLKFTEINERLQQSVVTGWKYHKLAIDTLKEQLN